MLHIILFSFRLLWWRSRFALPRLRRRDQPSFIDGMLYGNIVSLRPTIIHGHVNTFLFYYYYIFWLVLFLLALCNSSVTPTYINNKNWFPILCEPDVLPRWKSLLFCSLMIYVRCKKITNFMSFLWNLLLEVPIDSPIALFI